VIVAIQSFKRPEQGHFVVATKVTPCCVSIMDPNVRGNRRTITRAEMMRRWNFRERTGVIVTPKRKQLGADTATATATATTRSRQLAAVAIVSALVAIAATTASVVIYRRRQLQ
jgi:hypothetical protein